MRTLNQRRIDAVLALHREEIDFDGCCHYCTECTPDKFQHRLVVIWPCMTVRILKGIKEERCERMCKWNGQFDAGCRCEIEGRR